MTHQWERKGKLWVCKAYKTQSSTSQDKSPCPYVRSYNALVGI